MVIDHRYGRITFEDGTVGEDEPVVVFRAKDVSLPKLLAYYIVLCMEAGCQEDYIDSAQDARDRVISWQETNNDRVAVPSKSAFLERTK